MKKLLLIFFLFSNFLLFSQEEDEPAFRTFYPRIIKGNFLQIPFGGGSLSYEMMRGEKNSGETGISFRQGRSSFLHEDPYATQTSVAFFVKMTHYFTWKLIPPEGLHGFIYFKYAFHNVQFYQGAIQKSIHKNEVNVRMSTVGVGVGYQKRIHERALLGVFAGGGINPNTSIQIMSLTYPPGPDAKIFQYQTYLWDLIAGLTLGYNF